MYFKYNYFHNIDHIQFIKIIIFQLTGQQANWERDQLVSLL